MHPDPGAFMKPRFFKLFLAVVLGAGLASGAAVARETPPPAPALWQVSAGPSKVYLFGSIHMLPRDWAWRTKAIDAAIRSSDAFVFETALTPQQIGKMRLFVRDNGTLPRGQQLSRMLSPQGLKDFNSALTMTPLDPASVNTMRPWLALMVLGDYQIQNGPLRSFVEEGVDFTIEQEAQDAGKPVRHLETAESQFEILIQTTPDGDIAGFEAELHELLKVDDKYRRLLEGWTVGSQTELATGLGRGGGAQPRREEAAAGQAQPQLGAADRRHDDVEADDLRDCGGGAPGGAGERARHSVPPRLEGAADQDRRFGASAGLPGAQDRALRRASDEPGGPAAVAPAQ